MGKEVVESMERFEGVANTLFVPLTARISISKEFPEYFVDKKALELEQYLPDDAAKGSSQYTNMASVARYYNMDQMVSAFAGAHERCNVVYLGAGLPGRKEGGQGQRQREQDAFHGSVSL